jgi:hypothetical protein
MTDASRSLMSTDLTLGLARTIRPFAKVMIAVLFLTSVGVVAACGKPVASKKDRQTLESAVALVKPQQFGTIVSDKLSGSAGVFDDPPTRRINQFRCRRGFGS